MTLVAPSLPLVWPPPPSSDPVYRLTVEQYHAMIRAGILTDADPVEFIDGLLVLKMPKNPPHTTSTGRVRRRIDGLLPEGYHTRAQEPLTLADGEPEPDVVVARGTDERYTDAHPTPADAPLVVEVADATLERDRALKLPGYARGGVAVYWIVNLVDRQIETYSLPNLAGTYESRELFVVGQQVPVMIDGRVLGEIAVDALMP